MKTKIWLQNHVAQIFPKLNGYLIAACNYLYSFSKYFQVPCIVTVSHADQVLIDIQGMKLLLQI